MLDAEPAVRDRTATASPGRTLTTMTQLSHLTNAIKSVVPAGAKVGYVDYPMHLNVGDLLIFMGTMQFFEANENRISTAFCTLDASPRALARLDSCDVIVFHGGGNFGDIYPHHQALREAIVRRYPGKPIVVMPQSIHFRSRREMLRSGEIFRRHPNLTLCVRDLPSQSVAERHFAERVLLVPDMAHRLYPSFAALRASPAQRDEPFQLLRRDAEAPGPTTRDVTDWKDLLRMQDKLRIGRHRITSVFAGKLDWPAPGLVFAHHRTVDAGVRDLAERLAGHRRWTTNRLHGAILGLLLGRDVEALDNSYGKSSRYFAHWGRDLPNLSVQGGVSGV